MGNDMRARPVEASVLDAITGVSKTVEQSMNFYLILAGLLLLTYGLSKLFGWWLDILFSLVRGENETEEHGADYVPFQRWR
jgi:hypothetical protein